MLLSDALGSVVGLVDEGGWISDEYAYSAFGESVHSGADDRNSLGYTGREEDGTGLYYYRARYYDPELGRFISSDPIDLSGGINTFEYVFSDPISQIDPHGLANSGRFQQIPGTTTTVRVDNPHVPGQQKHAHISQKGAKDVVVNKDGTGSHGTNPKDIRNKKVLDFLRKLGFNILSIAEGLAIPIYNRFCEENPWAPECSLFNQNQCPIDTRI